MTLDGDNISLDELDDELDGRDDIYVELTYSGSNVIRIVLIYDICHDFRHIASGIERQRHLDYLIAFQIVKRMLRAAAMVM